MDLALVPRGIVTIVSVSLDIRHDFCQRERKVDECARSLALAGDRTAAARSRTELVRGMDVRIESRK